MKKNLTFLLTMATGLTLILSGCGGGDKTTADNKKDTVRTVPLEDFFKNPDKNSFSISPDGKYLSYLAPYEKRMNIHVQEIGNEAVVRLTSETERDVAGYFWGSDNRILFLKDSGGDENYKLFGVNADGTNLIGLTDFEGVLTQVIDDLPDLPTEMIIGLNKRNPQVFDAYRLNIETGEMNMIAENPGNIQGWMTDHDGKLRVAITTDGVNTTLMFRDKESDPFKPVITTSFKETLSPSFFTFDNKNLYAVSNLGRDKAAVVEFDIATGKEIKTLYENKDYDVSGLYFSRKRKVLTAAGFQSWKRERFFFDKEIEAIFDRLQKEFPNLEVGIVSTTREEDKYIIRTYSDRTKGEFYLYDVKTEKLDKIHEVSPYLKADEMAEMKPIEYKSRDGLTIHGYLTLPRGVEAKNLPVVVNPHGGPWYRDSWGFNPEVQFLANRGFAVLQMNFRGSTGYGREFWEASFKQWGLKMQDDITDGVNWLVEQGIADKDRVAIYGGSYGGYATLAGLTFTPDLYACGVDYVGVSNLFTFMKTIPPYWKPMLDMMYEMVGDPVKDSVQWKETSPVFHADKIKVPLFVAQGRNDPRVNIDEADQMVKAMKDRGVDVEYMVKDNEGHGFHNEENRFDFYRAMEKFLEKHLAKKEKQS
ncbi:MAG: S9 family peptidase [Bacteroidetes bacterium]|nr:S9 family peptidase [Bacteroidota bacterium]MBU1720167.1 S9 family peptidase [Bacteroidota bacterium]